MASFAEVRIEVAQARAVSAAKAGEILDLSESTVRRMIERNEIPYLRVGQRIIIPLTQLDEWIAAQHTPAVSA